MKIKVKKKTRKQSIGSTDIQQAVGLNGYRFRKEEDEFPGQDGSEGISMVESEWQNGEATASHQIQIAPNKRGDCRYAEFQNEDHSDYL